MAKQRLWVVRNKRGKKGERLWLCTAKPRRHKRDGVFYTPGNGIAIPEKLLPGVTWENSPKELKNIPGYSNRLLAYDNIS